MTSVAILRQLSDPMERATYSHNLGQHQWESRDAELPPGVFVYWHTRYRFSFTAVVPGPFGGEEIYCDTDQEFALPLSNEDIDVQWCDLAAGTYYFEAEALEIHFPCCELYCDDWLPY